MKVSRVIFHLEASKMLLHWLAANIDCSKHPESDFVMAANKFSTSPLAVLIHWEAQKALELNTT